MKKNVLTGFLLVALWLVLRSGRHLQTTTAGSCANSRFPLCADSNGDGRVDITDAVHTLSWLFTGGPEPACCADFIQGPYEWVANQAIPIPGRRSIGRFRDNGDGTVTDLLTGLEWQQGTADWVADGKIDLRERLTWTDALAYIQNLKLGGKSGWRVPTIKERQNADGGWSQAQGMTSDAWATGQALYALAHAGIKPREPVIRHAQAFLIKTQREDGSWPMTSRPIKPGGEGSNSLIPITGAGSAWGVLGLVRSR